MVKRAEHRIIIARHNQPGAAPVTAARMNDMTETFGEIMDRIGIECGANKYAGYPCVILFGDTVTDLPEAIKELVDLSIRPELKWHGTRAVLVDKRAAPVTAAKDE